MTKRNYVIAIVIGCAVLWALLHFFGVIYGTHKYIPLHQSYVGDEQSPVNGALHIVKDRSILGLRDSRTVYYGPVFSVLSIPAVVTDFVQRYARGIVTGAESYKDALLWDWGYIIIANRILAVLASLVGLWAVYKMFSKKALLGILALSLVGINYFYFEYSHFFKHWAFVLPLLSLEAYALLKIKEGEGKRWAWIVAWIATVMCFGMTYVSLMYQIFWLPILISLIREKDFRMIKKCLLWGVSLIPAFAFILWWHPYAFIHYLGVVGIGEPSFGLGDTQNPFARRSLADTSLDYYGTLVFFNHIALFLGGLLILGFFAFKGKIKEVLLDWKLWVFLAPAILNFFFFAVAEHHEGRYMLPSILFFILAFVVLCQRYTEESPDFRSRLLTIALVSCIAFNAVFHAVGISGWIRIYSRGPLEEVVMQDLLDRSKEGEKVILIDRYIVGFPHTKEAYRNYMDRFNKAHLNLYKEFLEAPAPATKLLDAYYLSEAEFGKTGFSPFSPADFDHIIYRYEERKTDLNQFDYIDENILRVWFYDDFSPQYFKIK